MLVLRIYEFVVKDIFNFIIRNCILMNLIFYFIDDCKLKFLKIVKIIFDDYC